MPSAGLELLTTADMYAADKAAIRGGVSGVTLMENAGAAVANAICRRWEPCPLWFWLAPVPMAATAG